MKALVLGVVLAAISTSAHASCSSDYDDMVNLTNYINNNSGSWGICQIARESAQLYWLAARYHKFCVSDGAAQAQEYLRAYVDAKSTESASCG